MFVLFSVVLKEHSFKTFHVLCSFKVLYVSNFTIINGENTPSWQEYSIVTW